MLSMITKEMSRSEIISALELHEENYVRQHGL